MNKIAIDTIPSEEVLSFLPYRIYRHIFIGRVSKQFRIYGVHHCHALTERDQDFRTGDIRIIDGTKRIYANGFYEAELQCWDGKQWLRQQEEKKNGFFPDHWTVEKTMGEIAAARKLLTPDNWLPPKKSEKKSNSYLGKLPCGQPVIFMIAEKRISKPRKLKNYFATVFPWFGG